MAVMLRRLAQRSAAAPWSHTAQTAASSGARPCFRPAASSPAVRPAKISPLPPLANPALPVSLRQTVPPGAAPGTYVYTVEYVSDAEAGKRKLARVLSFEDKIELVLGKTE